MIKAEFYEIRSINEILYNSQNREVAIFKEHLIFDDVCEFL